jgi:phosphogluconate dehydratase
MLGIIITPTTTCCRRTSRWSTIPTLIRMAARNAGGSAQVAGGVPAMCDGVTQGRTGMELSLFSRDVIAMATAISLSHDMFDAVLCLGVCDKIVPGLLIGALSLRPPAGDLRARRADAVRHPQHEKAEVRQLYARGQGHARRAAGGRGASYHSPGTCTFYGTANSNQMLMEVMGLHCRARLRPRTRRCATR